MEVRIQRYDMFASGGAGWHDWGHEECDDGDWVRYEDVAEAERTAWNAAIAAALTAAWQQGRNSGIGEFELDEISYALSALRR